LNTEGQRCTYAPVKRSASSWACAENLPGFCAASCSKFRSFDPYTLLSSDYDPGPCQSLADNPNCSIAQSQCVSTTPSSPLPPGIDPSQVAPDGCYQKQDTYACSRRCVSTISPRSPLSRSGSPFPTRPGTPRGGHSRVYGRGLAPGAGRRAAPP